MAGHLVPFYQTYILYNPHDIISILCVQLSLFPVYMMVFYTSWFLVTREIQPVITVAGHLVSEVVNKIIKHSVKQPRPSLHQLFGEGTHLTYGMPSAHSQFMGFFAAYFICIVLLQIPIKRVWKLSMTAFLLLSAAGVAFSRVYLEYHTTPQVIVGLTLGLVLGLAFFVILTVAREFGIVQWVLRWPVVHAFSIKDSYYHAYKLFEQEYVEVYGDDK